MPFSVFFFQGFFFFLCSMNIQGFIITSLENLGSNLHA